MRILRKRKRKINLKWKNIITMLSILVCLITLIISVSNIFVWRKDSDDTIKQVDKIQEIILIDEVTDDEDVEIVEQVEKIPDVNPYWDYIKMNLINVDFNELKKINNHTKGWIQVKGTNVNYPFVQANDNDYYLTHSFDKSWNSAGWVFMDYRNNINDMDRNTILYAHGRYDKTMFGTLRKILSNGWLDNTDNYVIKLSTEKENSLWQVFSIYKIPTTSDYLRVDFVNNEDFINFANMLVDRSGYDFDTSVGENDKILTLSTCYNDDIKTVVHAKLIKKEIRY